MRSGEAKLEFRNWTIIGPDSQDAAKAALAASEQGRYWSFITLFYRNQGTENSGYVTRLLPRSGGQGRRGRRTSRSGTRIARARSWDAQMAQGRAPRPSSSGSPGTPAFLVEGPNGQQAAAQPGLGRCDRVRDQVRELSPGDRAAARSSFPVEGAVRRRGAPSVDGATPTCRRSSPPARTPRSRAGPGSRIPTASRDARELVRAGGCASAPAGEQLGLVVVDAPTTAACWARSESSGSSTGRGALRARLLGCARGPRARDRDPRGAAAQRRGSSSDLPIDRIEICAEPENTASRRGRRAGRVHVRGRASLLHGQQGQAPRHGHVLALAHRPAPSRTRSPGELR